MTYRFGLLALLAAAAVGCFTDPPSPTSVGSTSGDESSSGTVIDPGTSSTTTDAASSSSSTGGPVGSCGAAQTAEACAAASDPDFEQCSWFPTTSYEALSCAPFDTNDGACIIEQGLDGCGEPEPTCDDGRSIYYRVVGEIVEVVDATSLCYGLSEFEPCPPLGSSGGSSSVGTTDPTGAGSTSDTGFGETGFGDTGFGETGGSEVGTSFGSTAGGSLEDEIAAVCACAC